MPSSISDVPSTVAPRRALVVEDMPETRVLLRRALQLAFPGIAVSEAGDLATARAVLGGPDAHGALPFDLALVDIGLPDGSGLDLIAELARNRPGVLPVVTTIFDDDTHIFDAIGAGAQGYLLKDRDAEHLVGYLRRIDAGDPPLSPAVARRIMTHFRSRPAASPAGQEEVGVAVPETAGPELADAAALTPREAEVLSQIGKGARVPEVAYRLGLSEQTVATYVKTIYRKLRISSRAEAALEAARRGLI
ncbi:response regulator transcription factor [Methylobrevis pamukkalensis]|uniref:Transcriptional regulatory protein DegU n=1 Tax=Methylobrevis pamukkalensis TaxID=1439726 RepID=A0A1E3H2C1_9HYPH|nr:response regulator transcription factor [Methylobrevis pamukkalensis]ODN70467.1 Transcriptional regulatory protein DegU [Methylobrevis pamukkalensis]